ncbi:MAG: M42 family peptidase, partial [Oscillospiraceae bacterium]
ETMEMSRGVAIGVGPSMNRSITNALFETARKNKLSFQTEVMGGSSGTNGWVFQVSREGVSTAVLSLPIKYMHSPVETMDLADAEAIVSLLTEFIINIGEAGI